MIDVIAGKLQENQPAVDRLLTSLAAKYQPPVYSSFDLRCNGHKAVAVDPNVFPAGFNNICLSGVRLAATLFLQIIHKRFSPEADTVAIYPEDHTKNRYYLENLYALQGLIQRAGLECLLVSTNPAIDNWPAELKTAEDHSVIIHHLNSRNDCLHADGRKIDLILSNNDFSTGVPAPLQNSSTPVIPPPQMGWHQRSKYDHFQKQKQVFEQLGQVLDLDPWYLYPHTLKVSGVDFENKDGFEAVASAIDDVIDETQQRYKTAQVDEPLKAFVKGDRGTYGMNVYSFSSGAEFLELSRSRRDSMNRRKGGEKNTSVIVQEGVRTFNRVEDLVAEPVLYCLEQTPICGFLRTNKKQNDFENLNARGMAFTPENLCPLFIDQADKNVGSNLTQPQIEVYKLLATCGTIACGMEIKELNL